LEKGGARAVEIKMWKSKSCGEVRAKRKKRKGRKMFLRSGMKILLRIGVRSGRRNV